MLDWETVVIPLKHECINGGRIVNLDRDLGLVYSVDKKLSLESTHSTKIQVKSTGDPDFHGYFNWLMIDGNIAKFFQGHNITGTDDLVSLIDQMVQYLIDEEIINIHEIEFQPDLDWPQYTKLRKKILWGHFLVKRIDINYMFKVNGGTVDEYIDFLADTTRTRFSRTNQPGAGSVYWNQKSTYWAMKAYNKTKEMSSKKKSHQLPQDWDKDLKDQIKEIVREYCRFELVLRSRKLKEMAEEQGVGDAWWYAFQSPNKFTDHEIEEYSGISPAQIFNEYFEKIQVSEMERFSVDEAIKVLKPNVYGTFAAWRSGINVKDSGLLKKSAYYKHRKIIIEALGVDIALSAQNIEKHSGTSTRVFKVVMGDQMALHNKITQLLEAA